VRAADTGIWGIFWSLLQPSRGLTIAYFPVASVTESALRGWLEWTIKWLARRHWLRSEGSCGQSWTWYDRSWATSSKCQLFSTALNDPFDHSTVRYARQERGQDYIYLSLRLPIPTVGIGDAHPYFIPDMEIGNMP